MMFRRLMFVIGKPFEKGGVFNRRLKRLASELLEEVRWLVCR